MRILEVANLRNGTQKLARQQKGHLRKVGSAQVRRMTAEGLGYRLEHDLAVLTKLAPTVTDTRGDRFVGGVRRGPFDEAQRLRIPVEVAGISWDAQLRWNAKNGEDPHVEFRAGDVHEALQFRMLSSRIFDSDLSSLSTRFESNARDIPDTVAELTAQLQATHEEVAQLRLLDGEEWPHKAELTEKQQRLAGLLNALEAEAFGHPEAAPAPSGHMRHDPMHAVEELGRSASPD